MQVSIVSPVIIQYRPALVQWQHNHDSSYITFSYHHNQSINSVQAITYVFFTVYKHLLPVILQPELSLLLVTIVALQ